MESNSGYRICPDCRHLYPSFLTRHRRRNCPSYSELWAGDVRRKLFEALKAYSNPGYDPLVRMVTVTAPGEEVGLVWDRSACWHRGEHVCSGRLGCVVDSVPADFWNGQAPSSWRSLNDHARHRVRRENGFAPSLLVRTWEFQKRGVLHVHLVLGYSSPRERVAADEYVAQLVLLAPSFMFGYVDRKLEVKDPSQAAAYLSSYFVDGPAGKMDLRETVTVEGVPKSVVYVSPSLSAESGITMRSLRLRRYLWHVIGSDGLTLLDTYLSGVMNLDDARAAYLMGLWRPEFINALLDAQYQKT